MTPVSTNFKMRRNLWSQQGITGALERDCQSRSAAPKHVGYRQERASTNSASMDRVAGQRRVAEKEHKIPTRVDEENPSLSYDEHTSSHNRDWTRIIYRVLPAFVLVTCTVLWISFYSFSLVGGDIDFIISNLVPLGTYLFSSVVFFLAAVFVAMLSRGLSIPVRVVVITSLIGGCGVLFLVDPGQNFAHHGAYNLLVFLVTAIPCLVIGLLEYTSLKALGYRRFLVVHAVLFFSTTVVICVAVRHFTDQWNVGFRGERMQPLVNRTFCSLSERGTPWIDLVPEGTQNFWAGKMTCGDGGREDKRIGFSARIDSQGRLNVHCKRPDVTYTPFPSTREWPVEEKLVESSYEGKIERPMNKVVMDNLRLAGNIAMTKGKEELMYEVQLSEGIEVVIVKCDGAEKIVSRVRKDQKALKRTKALPKGPLISPNSSTYLESSPSLTNSTKLDVVVLFFDATSRRAFHRRLRKTVRALGKADAAGLTNLYQFFRHGIVGFSTGPNSRAMYYGMTGHTKRVPGVWEDFSRSGWVTMFTVDSCEDIAAGFNDRTGRFDHELIAPFCHSDFFEEDGNPYGNFKGPYSIKARCLKNKQVHEHELNYIRSFQHEYADGPKFTLAWFMEGHEGTMEVLNLLDDGISRYIDDLNARDWNRTALVIVADHGLHMGLNFAFTRNGDVEHRNPFLSLSLPRWYTDQHNRHAILEANQQRLTSGLDLYHTLQGIRQSGMTNAERTAWVDEKQGERDPRGVDLAEIILEENRTCEQAAVPPQFCDCL